MIYLASPYSAKIHDCLDENGNQIEDMEVQLKRFLEACLACGMLMKQGELVYSPIAHWYFVDQLFKGEISHEDYLAADLKMLEMCREMHVLTIPGWEESRGVKLEIEFAKMKNKPIRYFMTSEEGIKYDDTK